MVAWGLCAYAETDAAETAAIAPLQQICVIYSELLEKDGVYT
jgi:hypothetical protein